MLSWLSLTLPAVGALVTSTGPRAGHAHVLPQPALFRRARSPQMQSTMGDSGESDAEMGNTYWSTWADEQGISSNGAFPPGEDAVEKELKRMFSLDSTDEGGISETEIDDMQLMFKLRKELGEDDFRRIFGGPKINGPSM